MSNSKLKAIGFPLSISNGGPSIFMSRLRSSIRKQSLARCSYFFDPFIDINFYSSIARNPWRKPYLLRIDGIYYDKLKKQEELNALNEPIFRAIDNAKGVVFQSQFAVKLVESFYKSITAPYTIINNGVDFSFFTPEGSNKRGELGIDDNALVFITSANWRSHKRLADVLEVFLRFSAGYTKSSHLIVLGAGNLPDNFDHDLIHFVGHVSPHELPMWYRTGDILLFFSWLDNCPNTVIEAIACGLPVICTNQGGTRELIELTNGGIIVDADDQFQFELVDLYHPPKPDYSKILDAVEHLVPKLRTFKQQINRSAIDIKIVAQKYVMFAASCLT